LIPTSSTENSGDPDFLYATLDKSAYAAFFTESRMMFTDSDELHRKSGGIRTLMTRRILIIDDEDDIRQVAAMSLETVAGWDVVLANSGKQGIERASAEQPDAILQDVMMPEMDGPTTLLKLKASGVTSHIPVLLLTAKVQGPDQRRFAEMGVAATLFKPFDPLTLARQISAALGWKEGD
jgi:CheY-like chemotaxis protein